MLSPRSNALTSPGQDSIRKSQLKLERGFQRLSSGQRVNSAKDDAAGLAIATRMTAQIRGAQQGVRNANDSSSLLLTAEGALQEVTNILQRMRELTVQAGNSILNVSDREAIQAEVEQLKSEINRINENANFNDQQIFSQHKIVSLAQTIANGGELNGYSVTYKDAEDLSGLGIADAEARRASVINNLQSSWLRQSERLVETHYGLAGVGGEVIVDFVDPIDGPAGVAAFVASSDPQRLHIDLHDFPSTNQPHGGVPNVYSDRIIAHEFVHIAMNANGVRQDVERWFNEGAAELIHGSADSRVQGFNLTDIAEAFNSNADGIAGTPDDINYTGSYIATAFLHQEVKVAGGNGLRDVFDELRTNGNNLSAAVATTTGYADLDAFKNSFTAGGGEALATTLKNGSNLSGDTGAIGGELLDGGPVQSAESIVPNDVLSTTDKDGGRKLTFQIGGNIDETLSTFIGSFNIDAMGLKDLDLRDFKKVDFALSALDDAINYISKHRSKFGAVQNRLDHSINSSSIYVESMSASRSRIMDADFAVETADLTRNQIIQQASTSILAQANIARQAVLSLLDS